MEAQIPLSDFHRVATELDAWHDTARQHARNEEYYRSLVIRIGEMLGPEAYISDDGCVQQDVLCAKVPELVGRLLETKKSGIITRIGGDTSN